MKKTIFGMLVVGVFLFAAASQMVYADDPPRDPGAQWYWIVHDDESTSTVNPEVQHVWSDNAAWTDYIHWGLYRERWYTAYLDNQNPYSGTIRPISTEGWKQNTWMKGSADMDEGDFTLYLEVYAPNCDNTEYFNWTILNAEKPGMICYFEVTAWDTDLNPQVIDYFYLGDGDSEQEKLDKYLTEFDLEIEFHREPL
jgi:hypothetical protein